MCGRFTLTGDWSAILEYYGLSNVSYATPPRYNIAPSQPVPAVITGHDREHRIGPLKTGAESMGIGESEG